MTQRATGGNKRLSGWLLTALERLEDLRQALEVLPLPVALLDERGEVLEANHAARAHLAKLNPTGAGQPELEAAIARALTHEAAAVWLTPRRARQGLILLPLLKTTLPKGRAPRQRGRVLALLHPAGSPVRLSQALLAELYALTPTEAALAAALAEGSSLSGFARERGSSEQTARTHLKRIFEKTSSRGQVDLVRLLLTTPATWRTEPAPGKPPSGGGARPAQAMGSERRPGRTR